MIDTREKLILALSEAAELEHGLLVQYLFAAFSIDRKDKQELSASRQLMLARWQKTILDVAQQEMFHLANVCNLLSAIGGTPQFGRPNFPQSNRSSFELGNGKCRHLPFDFHLERLNDDSLYRFIISELPIDELPPNPPQGYSTWVSDVEVYNYIGELYRLIEKGFVTIPEKDLFIGIEQNQDVEVNRTVHVELKAVKDRQSAIAAIEEIIKEGEGITGNRVGSHFESFTQIRKELSDERTNDKSFKPAKNVVKNPQTRLDADEVGQGTPITHEVTLKLAELFNDVYVTMLIILIQYYSFGGETVDQRNTLKNASRGMMSALIRPLAEMLTEMPVSTESDSLMAGPCFEIHQPILRLSQDAQVRWIILKERFNQQIKIGENLLEESTTFQVLDRLSGVYDNMNNILFNLQSAFEPKTR